MKDGETVGKSRTSPAAIEWLSYNIEHSYKNVQRERACHTLNSRGNMLYCGHQFAPQRTFGHEPIRLIGFESHALAKGPPRNKSDVLLRATSTNFVLVNKERTDD